MVRRVTSLLVILLSAISIFGVGFSSWLFVGDITDNTQILFDVQDNETYLTINGTSGNFTLTDVGFLTSEYEIVMSGSLNFDISFKNADARSSDDFFDGDDVSFLVGMLALNNNAIALLDDTYFSFEMSYVYNNNETAINNNDLDIDTNLHKVSTTIDMTLPIENVSLFSIKYKFTIIDINSYAQLFEDDIEN